MFSFDGGWQFYALIATLFFLGYVLARFIVRSPVGAVLAGIRQNADRTAALGHSVPGYKLSVFVLAAAYAGLAGALLGIFQSYMPPGAFSVDTSAQLVLQAVIGGVGTLLGPTVGAAVWLFLRDELQQIPGIGCAVDVHPGRHIRPAGDAVAQRALRHARRLVAVAPCACRRRSGNRVRGPRSDRIRARRSRRHPRRPAPR